ncbi:MAG TPA: helix-turn-helix transcriptional regulator [Candidatus Limnocylindrales bacterium]|nr:helix-turn-helix transcriptional regulator [Candidatus Limnocylindrales bacterium]
MATRERPADRGRRRAEESLRKLGQELRVARAGAGLSSRAVANVTETSHQQILGFERGRLLHPPLEDVAAWCATVGLDLVIRAFPGGDAIRDAGQQRLLERLRARLHPGLAFRTEVALPGDLDRRAWDVVITGSGWQMPVEAETVLNDVQALDRRLNRKARDAGVRAVLLVVADTRGNRRAILSAPAGLASFRRDSRRVLRALASGTDPGDSAILLL